MLCGYVALVFAILGVSGCGGEAESAPPAAPVVTVAKPVVRTETRYIQYIGNTAAVNKVDIVARVPGVLVKQNYELLGEDNKVKRVEIGDVLFEIEHEPYQIAVDTAEADVKRSEALVAAAQATYEGVKQRFDRGAAANIDLVLAEADLRQREAEVLVAQAQLAKAELDLSYTFVRSPIAGEVSRNLVDVGSYVGATGPTVLTRVTQTDPIYVYFDVSETIVQQYIARAMEIGPDTPLPPPPLQLATSANEEDTWPYSGTVDWWDRSVDRSTGSIVVRGRLDNKNGELVPGFVARIRVPFEQMPNTVLVQEEAIGTDLTGKYVLVVVKNEQGQPTVAKQPVTLGIRADDGLRQVEGLTPDAVYIVAGIQKARPGMPVNPQMQETPSKPAAPAPEDPPAPVEAQTPTDQDPPPADEPEGD
ncbi:MAG: efflux RND transporter periplasmic adaptor subunit [Planctomycetota bacterium]